MATPAGTAAIVMRSVRKTVPTMAGKMPPSVIPLRGSAEKNSHDRTPMPPRDDVEEHDREHREDDHGRARAVSSCERPVGGMAARRPRARRVRRDCGAHPARSEASRMRWTTRSPSKFTTSVLQEEQGAEREEDVVVGAADDDLAELLGDRRGDRAGRAPEAPVEQRRVPRREDTIIVSPMARPNPSTTAAAMPGERRGEHDAQERSASASTRGPAPRRGRSRARRAARPRRRRTRWGRWRTTGRGPRRARSGGARCRRRAAPRSTG